MVECFVVGFERNLYAITLTAVMALLGFQTGLVQHMDPSIWTPFWTPSGPHLDPLWTPSGPHLDPSGPLLAPHLDPFHSLPKLLKKGSGRVRLLTRKCANANLKPRSVSNANCITFVASSMSSLSRNI